MHRRRVGLVVIGSAVLLVAVVAGLRPHLVTGAARALPVPGPPVVGDCVVDPLPARKLGAVVPVTADSGGTVPVYPAQQIQPCTGLRYGEITAVITAPKRTVVSGDAADGRHLDDPNGFSCFVAGRQYLGIPTPPIQRFWAANLQFAVALSRPSSRQQAAGQQWVACIVNLPPSDPVSAPSQYGSSIQNALRTGQQKDQLGECVPVSSGGNLTGNGCTEPHVLEMLGYGDSGDYPVTRVQVELSCRRLVRQLTAMADPTAGGALAIHTDVQDTSFTVITTPQVPAHSQLGCGVGANGNRKLRGSLLRLGRQPIPWA